MVNLYEYITSYDILDDIVNPCIIIADTKPTRDIPNHITFYTFSDIFNNKITIPDEIPCVSIAYRITTTDMLTINKEYNIRPIWINLNPGLESILTKNNPEENDITTMLGQYYQVIEPVSIEQLLHSFQSSVYIRIHNKILPKTLQTQTWDTGFTKIIDSDKYSDYVLISNPSIADEVIGSIHHLSKHTDFSCNLYLQEKFSISLSTQLIDDIRRTQHIIIIIDHKATEQIRMYYETLIKEQTKRKDITIQYIFPQFHLVSSLLPEYLSEEAHFDQQAFTQYLLWATNRE